MNSTYDTQFRLNVLRASIEETLNHWKKVEPTLNTVSNTVKSWQKDWENLNYLFQREHPHVGIKAHNVSMALEDAVENRDNRRLAIKSVQDAYSELKNFGNLRDKTNKDFVPVYRKRAMKAAFGDYAYHQNTIPTGSAPVAIRVKSWIGAARDQLTELQSVPQNHRQSIAYNPAAEGSIYQRTASRVKAYIEDTYQDIAEDITPESKKAIKTILDIVENVEVASNTGMLDQARRRSIHAQLRKAFKKFDEIVMENRQPAVKADVFRDIEDLRKRIDHLSPLLQSGRFDESDLYRDVTEAIDSNRSIANAVPIKSMPTDTLENFHNIDKSLAQILMNRNPVYRAKALDAAAANLDLIASDLAQLENYDRLSREGFVDSKTSKIKSNRFLS